MKVWILQTRFSEYTSKQKFVLSDVGGLDPTVTDKVLGIHKETEVCTCQTWEVWLIQTRFSEYTMI